MPAHPKPPRKAVRVPISSISKENETYTTSPNKVELSKEAVQIKSPAVEHRVIKGFRFAGQIDAKIGICKPFAKTGYCPYGESCKYAHIRGEVTACQEERNRATAERDAILGKLAGDNEESSHNTCSFCGEKTILTHRTSCGHPLCSSCANAEKLSTSCPVCGNIIESIV